MRHGLVLLFTTVLAGSTLAEAARLTGLARRHDHWVAAVWFPEANYGLLLPEGDAREGWKLVGVDVRHEAVTMESPGGPVRLSWSGALGPTLADPGANPDPTPPSSVSRLYDWERLVPTEGFSRDDRRALLNLLAAPPPPPRSREADPEAMRNLRLILASQRALPVRLRLMNELAGYRGQGPDAPDPGPQGVSP